MAITEYGDILIDGVDEWGRRKINGLLEDGVIIVIVIAFTGDLTYIHRAVEIILDT